MCEFFKKNLNWIILIVTVVIILFLVYFCIFYIVNACWEAAGVSAALITGVATIALALVTYGLVWSNIMDRNDKKNAEISAKVIYPLWEDVKEIRRGIQEECDVKSWRWKDVIDKKYANLTYDPLFNIRKDLDDFHEELSKGQSLKNEKNKYTWLRDEVIKDQIEKNEKIGNKIDGPIEKIKYALLIGGDKVEISFFRLIFAGEKGNLATLDGIIGNEKKEKATKREKKEEEINRTEGWIEDEKGDEVVVEDGEKEIVFTEIRQKIEDKIKNDNDIKEYVEQCKIIFEAGKSLIKNFENFFKKIK